MTKPNDEATPNSKRWTKEVALAIGALLLSAARALPVKGEERPRETDQRENE